MVGQLGERAPSDVARAVCEEVLDELFGASPASLFSELSARLRACDRNARDLSALAPSPALTRRFERLVELLRFERFDRRLALPVSQQLLARIRGPHREQARVIRTCAGLAETAMEQHYARVVTDALAARARTQLGDRAQTFLAWLAPFPYGQSYAHLVTAELELLACAREPVLLHDRELSALGPTMQRHVRALCGALAQRPWASGLDRIAVCGCGPLPITGVLMQLATDAHVLCIDHDASAVAQATRFVAELERLGLLASGAVTVRHGDAAELDFAHCDVLLVASLVDTPAKLRLARRLCAHEAPLAVLMRSASSLCAELAYEPVPTAQLCTPGLAFFGESVPENQIFTELDADVAARRGVTAPGSRELRVRAHRSVLNTTELYRRLPIAMPVAAMSVYTDAERALACMHEAP